MDWTNVFEEDGEEQFLISQQLTALQHPAPRLARLVSRLYHQQQQLPPEAVAEEQEWIDEEKDYDDDDDDDANDDDDDDDDMGEHRLFQLSAPSPDSLHRHRKQPASTLTLSSSNVNANRPTNAYTLRALYYLSINYILGVGCLGIPYAFARAGFLLCSAILLVVTLSSYMTVMWVAECGERYHDYWQQQQQQQQQLQQQQQQHEQKQQQPLALEETSPLLARNPSTGSGSSTIIPAAAALVDLNNNNNNDNQHYHSHQHQHQHQHQHWDRYEVVDLVGFYLGPGHKILYQVALMALMYIGLLAYSQVFCSAVAELLWGQQHAGATTTAMGIPQLVFGAMVIPLSCVELDEQITIQSFMAAVRFVAIFIMVFGSLLSLLLDDSNNDSTFNDNLDPAATLTVTHTESRGPPYWAPAEPENCQMSYTFCMSGFGVAFSTSLFSQLFQHSIPGLLRPLRDQPTKHSKVPKTLGASLLTTLSFYLLLGTSAASFFGANTRSSVNLNFATFTMGLDTETAPIILVMAVRLAANIVVIFPALDTISVFPLIANTLGNNLCAAAVGPKTIKWVARSLHGQQKLFRRLVVHPSRQRSDNNNNHRNYPHYERSSASPSQTTSFVRLSQEERKALIERASRVTTIGWRLVAALPPLLGSLVAADLSFSLLLAGVAGVYVAFFAPSLMQIKSTSSSVHSSTAKTIFNGWYSYSFLCYPVLAFAAFSLGAVLLQIKGAWLAMMK